MTDLPDKQKVPPQPQGTITVSKERELPTWPAEKKAPIIEVGKMSETAAEKEGYIERVEKEAELKQPVTDDQGQVLVTPSAPQQPQIILPVKARFYTDPKNWHKPIVEAIRWLLVWTQRIVKMNPGRTVFENDTNS